MKPKPILFSTPMVQAILEGRKTMTRRIIPEKTIDAYYEYDDWASAVGNCEGFSRLYEKEFFISHAKYQVGDILWVRETFTVLEPEHCMGGMDSRFVFKANMCADSEEIRQDYIRCGYPYQWKPCIFMPYEAARIFLEVSNVRCEQLQDISKEDAIAEGIERDPEGGFKSYEIIHSGKHKGPPHPHSVLANKSAIISFRELWESINGPGSWEANPWVFVYEFKRTEKPIN